MAGAKKSAPKKVKLSASARAKLKNIAKIASVLAVGGAGVVAAKKMKKKPVQGPKSRAQSILSSLYRY